MGKNTTREYGVELVRGEVYEPVPHPETCDDLESLRELAGSSGRPLAADLFCGAGGLSLGLREAGFDVVVGVDTDQYALETHSALFPGMHLDWDLSDPERVEEVAAILKEVGVTLIAGGPPCQPFSKAGRSLIRDLVRRGHRPPEDVRRDLWQSFLAIVERVRPPAVLMENVPDMALDRDMLILRTMVDELERLGYGVDAEVLETATYGVPQHRQRLILIALAENRPFQWPHEVWRGGDEGAPLAATLRDAIEDLGDVEPGWQAEGVGGLDYDGPQSEFQERMRRDVPAENRGRVFDHVTRSVRDDDLEAFQLLDSEMRYSDLPEDLKRYRDDIFDDKYKRLSYDALCRTITAHMAKDGYWYIHPEYHRTLTVREAARVQTFGDHIRFAGPPTAALRQIGNAVPPALAEHLGRALLSALESGRERAWNTRAVSQRLADWWSDRADLVVPWLNLREDAKQISLKSTQGRWVVLQAEILLQRATTDLVRILWPRLSHLTTPTLTLENEDILRWVLGNGGGVGRGERLDQVIDLARNFADSPELLTTRSGLGEAGAPPSATDVAMRVFPGEEEDAIIVSSAVLRVAARFNGSEVHRRNRNTDGRIAIARLVGIDPAEGDADREWATGSKAHLSLLELSMSLCRADVQHCDVCPLTEWCATAKTRTPERLPLSSSA